VVGAVVSTETGWTVVSVVGDDGEVSACPEPEESDDDWFGVGAGAVVVVSVGVVVVESGVEAAEGGELVEPVVMPDVSVGVGAGADGEPPEVGEETTVSAGSPFVV
jgi:hypothetical protein